MRTAKPVQTGQMLMLILVFAGAHCTCHFVGFVVLWLNYVCEPLHSKTNKRSVAQSNLSTKHSRDSLGPRTSSCLKNILIKLN